MIHIVDKIKSTNSWLSENFQGMSDMILAFQQLEGRGRRGNDWESIYGGLYFSLVSPSHKLLPFISGISVVQTLNSISDKFELKWPNDIIFHGKKIGGILCEDYIDYSIVGIGLNIDNQPSISNSTSLALHELTLNRGDFVKFFVINFREVLSYSSKQILSSYMDFDCLMGKRIFWDNKSGIPKSINLDGSLSVLVGKERVNLYAEDVSLDDKYA